MYDFISLTNKHQKVEKFNCIDRNMSVSTYKKQTKKRTHRITKNEFKKLCDRFVLVGNNDKETTPGTTFRNRNQHKHYDFQHQFFIYFYQVNLVCKFISILNLAITAIDGFKLY